MKTKQFYLVILSCLVPFLMYAQTNTQVVRGSLVDEDSQMPLIGATVQILDHEPVLGAITDINGNFRIEKVPVGRVSMLVTYVGYEQRVIPNILVNSAKEVVLTLTMRESLEQLEAVVVTATESKSEVLNEMAMISARSFSVEETQRYAGALSDPARMVASFAGVTGNAEGNNDIVVRGNSSRGILWKLEGIEIPNPNHFANDGSSGGPVNALNSHMLSNSDFFSGAFAPEYGNALSGVFDMKLKKGNDQRREHTTSASVFGIDFTSEGPISSGYNGSYIANYRYSSLQLLSDIGLLDFGGVPKYQDASFKVDLPINENHRVSIFGLGGLSSIDYEEENDDEVQLNKGFQKSDLGVIGINHTQFISKKSFMKQYLSVSTTRFKDQNQIPNSDQVLFTDYQSNIKKAYYRYGNTFNHKFNAKHKLELGAIFTHYTFSASADSYDFENSNLENVLDDTGSSNSLQLFTTWKYRMAEQWTMTSGFHYLYFGLNEAALFEPRFALRFEANKRNAFTLGAGLHSRLESITIYLSKYDDGIQVTQPNKSLKPSRAAHFVLGYDRSINTNTHLKIETYYQHLFDVPVGIGENSSFSLLNESYDFVNIPMVNEGTGKNYGVELTLERYFNKGFYYMTTVSLYESFYETKEGISRRTAFDGNYVANIIAGKEFSIGDPAKGRVMFVNTKTALIGGARYTPIDLEASQELGTEVRNEDKPFSAKGDDIFLLNLAVGVRRNKKKTTSEFKLDFTNITNHQATVNEYYIEATGEIEESPQLPILPNIVYTLKF